MPLQVVGPPAMGIGYVFAIPVTIATRSIAPSTGSCGQAWLNSRLFWIHPSRRALRGDILIIWGIGSRGDRETVKILENGLSLAAIESWTVLRNASRHFECF